MHASECRYARKMKIGYATIRPQSAIFIGFKMCQACASEFFLMQKKKLTEGYHQQKLLSDHFYDVVQYIKYHDKGTVKRMVKKNGSLS